MSRYQPRICRIHRHYDRPQPQQYIRSASYLDDVQQLTTRRLFICVLRKRGSIYTDDFVNGKCRGSVNEPTLKTKNKTILKSKLKIRKLAITMRILV